MSEPNSGTTASETPLEDRLDSWKQIAEYLGRDVTTVQRWEKREGMPVHRHVHDKIGSVYAFRADLNTWMRGRNLRGAAGNEDDTAAMEAPAEPPLSSPVLSAARTKPSYALLLIAVGGILLICALVLRRSELFWRNPLADARFQPITDFDGSAQAATVSGDGHFVAFLSDRDGSMDVWITQVNSGEFHNLTRGGFAGLANPSLRVLGFSPDGSLVTFWVRKPNGKSGSDISIWGVPVLGGEPRPYLEGVAEYSWSPDGSRLTYHTPGPGDPLFVSNTGVETANRPIFTAPAGLHSHFPLWAPDMAFVYFVQGSLPDKLDIWRIKPGGGIPERITSQNAGISYPVLLDRRTLLYLASNPDDSGPAIYGIDVERRISHRLSSSIDRYTSIAASADGHRLVVTRGIPSRTLWRVRIDDISAQTPQVERIPLTTSAGFSPRLGPGYLLYVSETGGGGSIWKLVNGMTTQLWKSEDARIIGGPAISPDGAYLAFSSRQHGKAILYLMKADGTNARVMADSLDLQGDPSWAQNGQSIISAADDNGVPHLFRFPVDGGAPKPFVQEYSVDPVSTPDGRFVIYSGPDIGTTFPVKAVTAEGAPHTLRILPLTRGARHLAFLPGGRAVVMLRGEIRHKDLWSVDIETGAEQQLTHLPSDFDIRDFDISPDGREVVLERVQERSDVVLLDIPRP